MITPRPIPSNRMRHVLLAGLALAGAGCRKAPPDGVALVGGTVIDGAGGAGKPDMVVIVRRDLIEAIVPRADYKLPKRTVEIDVTGKYVIPGLIDGHGHVARWALPRYLAAGITTVRDVHGQFDSIVALREAANLGAITGPRIYTAGAMIDGTPITLPDALPASDGPEARRQVDKLAIAGVDYVKAYGRVTPSMLKDIVDEAQTFGLKVTAHLGFTDAVQAADAGVRSIEHLSGVPEAAAKKPEPIFAAHRAGFWPGWTAFEKAWTGLDSASLDRVAKALVKKEIIVIPTLVLHETFAKIDPASPLSDPAIKAFVPDSEVLKWNVPDMLARAGWDAADYEELRAARANQDLFVRLYRAAGGKVVAGTDASIQLMVPGISLHRELSLLVRAGFTPGQALSAATRDAALLLGADSIGMIVPGMKADMVVLEGDPLADISNVSSVSVVVLKGQVLPADSIRTAW